MFQNLLSKLPFLNRDNDEDLSDEELEAQAKKDRIEFHRLHVRNGPTTFKHVTNGQVRRQKARSLQRQAKKTRRKQVRNYLQTQQLAAVTRGHLQAAGLIAYAVPRELDREKQARSAVWLVQHFTEGPTSYAYNDVLAALSRALKFYGQAVGLPGLQVPADYVVPVYEEGTAPEGVQQVVA